jgi:GDP-L-fucose synthase
MLPAVSQAMMDKSEKIFVAGHRGMVGSALVRRLESEGFSNLLLRDRSKLDLRDESAVAKFFAEEKPAVVISSGKGRGDQGKQRFSS